MQTAKFRKWGSGADAPSRRKGGKQTARGRAVSKPYLPICIHLVAHQVLPRLRLPY
jgi:hypothetical protein